MRKPKEFKWIFIQKDEEKLSLFTDDMTVFLSTTPRKKIKHQSIPIAGKQLQQCDWI